MTSRLDDATRIDTRVVDGRYRLDAVLDNARPWAVLWIGEDTALKRPVAVRLLDPTHARTPGVLDAARRAAAIVDARSVRILDITPATGDEPAVLVRAWVDGPTLAEHLGDGPMDPIDAAELVAELADVVASAHETGVADAWLDPQHVVLTPHGDAAVLDLGVTAALGPAPGPQDTADAAPADPSVHAHAHADVRALGGLLYAAVTARWPLPSSTSLDPAPTAGDPPVLLPPRRVRAGVPGPLDVAVRRALGETIGAQGPLDDPRELALELRRWTGRARPAARRSGRRGAGPVESGGTTRGRTSRPARVTVGLIVAALAVGLLALTVQVLDGLFGEPDGSPPPGPTRSIAP